jgi:hypothetical protein
MAAQGVCIFGWRHQTGWSIEQIFDEDPRLARLGELAGWGAWRCWHYTCLTLVVTHHIPPLGYRSGFGERATRAAALGLQNIVGSNEETTHVAVVRV